MPFRIAYRESPDRPLATADVPHLAPIRRAVETGKDRFVRLPDGRRIRPSLIISVAELDAAGRTIGAWEVRSSGLDGRHEWRRAWREVAGLVMGILPDDPRWRPVHQALDGLEAAWRQRQALAWQAARGQLDRAVAAVAAVADGPEVA